MSNQVSDLEPVTRAACEEFERRAAMQTIPIRVTQTLRTLAEQQAYWEIGRAQQKDGVWIETGKVVTHAKPGESAHNFGMAFDICFIGKTIAECYPPHDDIRWRQLGELGEAIGLAWGGNWTGWKDFPHFERRGWKALVTEQPGGNA